MGEVDPKLMEMADVFHIPFKERLKYIILPAKFGGFRPEKGAAADQPGGRDPGGNDSGEDAS